MHWLVYFVIIIIIFTLFYPFGCQVLFLLFMHKLCPFFPVITFLLASFHVTYLSLKMFTIDFPMFFLGVFFSFSLPYLLYGSAIIRPHQMTKQLDLLFMYFLRYWFNFQLLCHYFVSYSVFSRNPFYSLLQPGFYFWCFTLAPNSHNRMWKLGRKSLDTHLLWSFLSLFSF